MDTSEDKKPVKMTVEVPNHVNKAMRNECLRRQLKGEEVHLKDIHREWLVQMAAQAEPVS